MINMVNRTKTIKADKKIFLGFTGIPGVGKTTTSDLLVMKMTGKRLSFSNPLKKACAVLTGFSMEYFTDKVLKEQIIPGLNVSPRELMQKIGTDCIRDTVSPDFFIVRMRNSLSNWSSHNIFIDDIRFEDEAKLVRDNGGIIVHLERNIESSTKHMEHKSENKIMYNNNDIVVRNVGNLQQTAIHIKNILDLKY